MMIIIIIIIIKSHATNCVLEIPGSNVLGLIVEVCNITDDVSSYCEHLHLVLMHYELYFCGVFPVFISNKHQSVRIAQLLDRSNSQRCV